MPSLTSWRIFSVSSASARASLTHDVTLATRSATSTVSSSSTLRSSDRSGHQPAASARASGSSMPRRTSARRRPPSCSSSARKAARSSVPRARASSVTGGSTGSASSHRAAPVPATPPRSRARCSARTTRAGVPEGRAPRDSIVATVPTVAWRPSRRGTRRSRSSSPTASTAARASSVSRAIVSTMPGSTTPLVRGRTGRVRVVVSGVSFTIAPRGRWCLVVSSSTPRSELLFPRSTFLVVTRVTGGAR